MVYFGQDQIQACLDHMGSCPGALQEETLHISLKWLGKCTQVNNKKPLWLDVRMDSYVLSHFSS